MRYGYHTKGNYYGKYYSPTKTHIFDGQSIYMPMCGAKIAYIHERKFVPRHFIETINKKRFCQNCLRILVSRYVRTHS